MAIHVGEDLYAESAEVVHRALQLFDSRVGILHGKARGETQETVRVAATELGCFIVGEPCQIAKRGSAGDLFQGWRRQGEDLLIPLELVHDAQPEVQVIKDLSGDASR